MVVFKEIIEIEESRLSSAKTPNEKLNILYNLIVLKKKCNSNDCYKHVKALLLLYIECIKTENYGYDKFNYFKINRIIEQLNSEEQLMIMEYSISCIKRELPEFDLSWFISTKQDIEIKHIFKERKWINYPRAILLWIGRSLYSLVLSLLVFFSIVSLILLPVKDSSWSIFYVEHQVYSSNTIINHLLNCLAYFADLEDGLSVSPKNGSAVILMIIAKVSFLVVIGNYVYMKISEKISLK